MEMETYIYAIEPKNFLARSDYKQERYEFVAMEIILFEMPLNNA